MILTKAERVEPNKRATGRTIRAEEARRARCILMLAEGVRWAQIRDKLSCNDSFVARWGQRFEAERLAGLYSRHKGRFCRKVFA